MHAIGALGSPGIESYDNPTKLTINCSDQGSILKADVRFNDHYLLGLTIRL